MSDSTGSHEVDTALLRRIAEGDSEAIGELYDRHAGLLYGLLLHILRDATEAEHVLQDVFVQVRDQLDSYRRYLGTVEAWLIGLARYRAVERLRSRPPHERGHDRDESGAQQRGMRLGRGRDQQEASVALAGLPAEQRQLIEQAFLLGFDHVELAARHRLPIGIVESRVRTGMSVLVEQLPILSRIEER